MKLIVYTEIILDLHACSHYATMKTADVNA